MFARSHVYRCVFKYDTRYKLAIHRCYTSSLSLYQYPVSHEQSSLPGAAVECWVQTPHESTDVAAITVENVSAGQFSQPRSPGCSLYVPALQAVHCVPSAPEYPGIQVQSVIKTLCASENVKDGHAVHVSPEEAPSTPENVPAWQASHVSSEEAPSTPENVPVPHGVHAPTPVVGLYVPAGQAPHAAPSSEVP